MKTLKKILIPLFLVATLLLTMALASCKKECEHEFEWLTVPPTCTEEGVQLGTCTKCGETEKTTSAPLGHTGDGLICEVCGDPAISLTSLFPEISDETSSLGVVVKDVRITNLDSQFAIELAELVVYSTEDGIGGYVDGEATMTTAGGWIGTMSVYGFIEGENLYLYIHNDLQSDMPDTYSVYPLAAILESNPQISQALAMAEMMLPTIETWLNESFLPCFGELNLPEDTVAPELTEENAIKAATAILNLFFKVETTDAGYTVILDLSIFENAHNALNKKTVAEVVDLIGGTGTFENLEKLIPTMLDYTVADLVEFVSVNLGVDITKLLASLDELAVELTGSPEATIEMLLGIEGLDDIQALLNNEEFLATNIRDFLMMAFEVEDAATLDAQIAEIVNVLKTATPYQLIGVDEEAVAEIGAGIDMLVGMISYEITVGKDGKFVSSELALTIEEAGLYVTATLTPEKLSAALTDGVEGGNKIVIEVIPGYKPTPNSEKEAAIKAALATAPEITEEALASVSDYYAFAPIYDGEELVGAIILEDYSIGTDDDGNKLIYVNTAEFYFDNLLTELSPGCSGKIEVSFGSFYTSFSVRAYTVNSDIGEDEEAFVIELFESSYDYVIHEEYSNSYSFSVCYDTVSGEYVEHAYHLYEIDIEKSVFAESCGEVGKYVYVCDECGEVAEESYTIPHGENSSTKSYTYDEETATYVCTLTCECGEVFSVMTVHIDGDIALTYRETENTSPDAVELSFVLPTAGTYTVLMYSTTNDGYAHIYSKGAYVVTNDFDADDYCEAVGYFQNTECYLSLRFHGNDVENEITISVYPTN